MSTAGSPAARASIREGPGSGINPDAALAPTAHPLIPSIVPTKEGIIKRLQGRTIMLKKPKQELFEKFFNHYASLHHMISNINPEMGNRFSAIQWGSKLNRNYSADILGSMLYAIYEATPVISPLSIHFTLLSPEQQTFVRELYNVVDRATHEEHVEENNKFSNAFIHAASLPPGEYDRPYLMNGYLPICLEIRKCITCTHPYCDEPNSNRVAQQSNEAAKMRYDAQCASDQNAWDRGETVYNTNGVVLKEGRKRPPPQYAQLILNCHCEQFNCSNGSKWDVFVPHLRLYRVPPFLHSKSCVCFICTQLLFTHHSFILGASTPDHYGQSNTVSEWRPT